MILSRRLPGGKGVTGAHDTARDQVDPADEGDFRRFAGVDDPGFLVLAVALVAAVPPRLEAGIARAERLELGGTARKGLRLDRLGLRIDAPEDDADVQSTAGGAIEHIEQGSAAVRHPEVLAEKGDRQPDSMVRGLDRFADPPEGRLAVHKGAHEIAAPHRIGRAIDGGNVGADKHRRIVVQGGHHRISSFGLSLERRAAGRKRRMSKNRSARASRVSRTESR